MLIQTVNIYATSFLTNTIKAIFKYSESEKKK